MITDPNVIQIDKEQAEDVEFLHQLFDLCGEKMNVAEEFRAKVMIRE